MCHDSARYWKDSDKQCQPNPCSCGGYLQEEPNNNNKTAKKSTARKAGFKYSLSCYTPHSYLIKYVIPSKNVKTLNKLTGILVKSFSLDMCVCVCVCV